MFRSVSRLPVLLAGLAALLLSGCADGSAPAADAGAPPANPEKLETAIFAGGCFWCVEEAFDEVTGVHETTSGYTGGHVKDPSYKQVTRGNTGHFEALRVRYDPAVVSYETLLEHFWYNVDPLDAAGQFCDKGSSYLSAIFVQNERQQALAEASKQQIAAELGDSGPVVTPILPAKPFYAAEDYHQNYHNKNTLRYKYYKTACGRTDRLEEVWGEKAGGPS